MGKPDDSDHSPHNGARAGDHAANASLNRRSRGRELPDGHNDRLSCVPGTDTRQEIPHGGDDR
jgi:hypothetical protein